MHFLLQVKQPLDQPREASCRAILQCLRKILRLEFNLALGVCTICARGASGEGEGGYGERFWIGFAHKQGDDARDSLQWQNGTDW